MGSNEYLDARLVHKVKISEPFYIGKYEVTQKQWGAVMENNPSTGKATIFRLRM